MDPKVASNAPSRLSRVFDPQFWGETSTSFSKTSSIATTSPPAAGGGVGRNANAHDSLVAPLQPIALQSPIPPARDSIVTEAVTVIEDGGDYYEDDNETDDDDETDDDETDDDEDDDEIDDDHTLYDRGPPRLPELPEMSSPGFMREMRELPLRNPNGGDWSSGQPSPTSWEQHTMEGDAMPDGPISEWDAEGVVDWLSSLGLGKYREALLENDISGEALIRLGHDELRELGISSVGHRLSILKHVYEIKMAHDVPMDPDDYIPVSADDHETNKVATQHDIQRLIGIVKKRDERILEAESQIHALYEAMARLRNDLLPVWRMVKNKNQELPPLSGDAPGVGRENLGAEAEQVQDPQPTPPASSSLLQPAPTSGKGLSRKFSMKKLILGTPKNASPTYPPAMPEYTYENVPQNNGLQSQPVLPPPMDDMRGHPSPTSPAATTIHHPSYASQHSLPNNSLTARPIVREPPPPPQPQRQTPRTPHYDDDRGSGGGNGSGGGGNGEPDIFKSFRVSMEDPCRKVLPAALKRYNIQADWRQYALYIVHGDQERCLGLEEKPLILFKQLDREGRKPMFMLRRNAGGGDSGGNIRVPGGVL